MRILLAKITNALPDVDDLLTPLHLAMAASRALYFADLVTKRNGALGTRINQSTPNVASDPKNDL